MNLERLLSKLRSLRSMWIVACGGTVIALLAAGVAAFKRSGISYKDVSRLLGTMVVLAAGVLVSIFLIVVLLRLGSLSRHELLRPRPWKVYFSPQRFVGWFLLQCRFAGSRWSTSHKLPRSPSDTLSELHRSMMQEIIPRTQQVGDVAGHRLDVEASVWPSLMSEATEGREKAELANSRIVGCRNILLNLRTCLLDIKKDSNAWSIIKNELDGIVQKFGVHLSRYLLYSDHDLAMKQTNLTEMLGAWEALEYTARSLPQPDISRTIRAAILNLHPFLMTLSAEMEAKGSGAGFGPSQERPTADDRPA